LNVIIKLYNEPRTRALPIAQGVQVLPGVTAGPGYILLPSLYPSPPPFEYVVTLGPPQQKTTIFTQKGVQNRKP